MNRREFTKNALLASTAMLGSVPVLNSSGTRGSSANDSNLPQFKKLFNGKDLTNFVNVNTASETWFVKDGILKCNGWLIGVMRTEEQYESFILDIECRFMEEGGNSGFFLWADGVPYKANPFPTGMEGQMLDPEWAVINERPVEYVHGHLFPVRGLEGRIHDNQCGVMGGSQ